MRGRLYPCQLRSGAAEVRTEQLRRIAVVAVARSRPIFRPGRQTQSRVRFGAGVLCDVGPGGRLVIGGGVEIGVGTTLAVGPWGEVGISERPSSADCARLLPRVGPRLAASQCSGR